MFESVSPSLTTNWIVLDVPLLVPLSLNVTDRSAAS
jgi:hypothetical protein